MQAKHNQYFAEYYSYFYGHPRKFLLEIKTSSGENRSVTVAALPKAKIREIRSERYPNRVTARGLNQRPGKNDGHGVIPDFIVQPTIQKLAEGRDEVLDFVLNLIQK